MYLLLPPLPPPTTTSYAKAELARKQAEYHAQQRQRMIEEQSKAGSSGKQGESAPPLADLPMVPYLDSNGKISDAGASPKVGSIKGRGGVG